VDREYDLSSVDTDNITIGQNVAGPLGTATIELGELLKTDQISEMVLDDNGNYVIRYGGSFEISPSSSKPTISDNTHYSVPAIPITTWGSTTGSYPLPADVSTVDLGSRSTGLEFEHHSVRKIDRVVFDTDGDNSELRLDIALTGIEFTSATGTLDFEVEFPEGYELAPATLPAGVTLTAGAADAGQKLSGSFALQNFTDRSLSLKVIEAVSPDSGDQISFSAEISSLKQNDVVTITAAPSVSLSGAVENLTYEVIYGAFDLDMAFEGHALELDGLDKIFDGADNILRFSGMYITLETDNNVGIPADVNLSIEPAGGTPVTIVDVPIHAPVTYGGAGVGRVLIGTPNAGVDLTGYTPAGGAGLDLGGLLANSPTQITFSGSVATGSRTEPMFYPKNPSTRVNYNIVVPLTPSPDFRAGASEIIKDLFDKDLIETLFKDGSMQLTISAENGLPLGLEMKLVVLDENEEPLVDLTAENNSRIASCTASGPTTSEVTFSIDENDMALMATARHLKFDLATGGSQTATGIAFRPDQKLMLGIKMRKTGGLTIK
jgi:hypothetical protein